MGLPIVLPILDRRRRFFRRRRRQRGLGTRLLCVGIGPRRLWWNVGGPGACGYWLGRRRRLCFRARCRLQRRGRLRQNLRIARNLFSESVDITSPSRPAWMRAAYPSSNLRFLSSGDMPFDLQIVREINGQQRHGSPGTAMKGPIEAARAAPDPGIAVFRAERQQRALGVPGQRRDRRAAFRRTRISAPSSSRTISTVPSP